MSTSSTEIANTPMKRSTSIPVRDWETQAFITNEPIGPEDAEAWVTHYAYRWCIENKYRSIKQKFLARTSSTNHALRIYYFVFGILMYNVWRLTDVLLKAPVSHEIIDYTPVITAGELADWIAIHLQLDWLSAQRCRKKKSSHNRQLSSLPTNIGESTAIYADYQSHARSSLCESMISEVR